MSTGPCEAAPIARDCQFFKMVVVRPLVPKGLMYMLDPVGGWGTRRIENISRSHLVMRFTAKLHFF